MRRHGWQLPYHPLQVVAISVFLALGFAFYVFFVPFVGGDEVQYVVMGIYTPLITSVVMLYVWCAATDPGDPGILKSIKHPKSENIMQMPSNLDHKVYQEGKPLSDGCSPVNNSEKLCNIFQGKNSSFQTSFTKVLCLICKRYLQSDDQCSEQHASEEGMFFCTLCEVEVLQNSKHCRVCDKCIYGFDHHCRVIMQWLVGVLVLILCFMKRGEFSGQIVSKLGSSFSTAAFVVVVLTCTLLAMMATIPVSQLLCFHVLLIKKGISTYDYIIALREQEDQPEVAEHKSPQTSIISSVIGFSTASSISPLPHGSWCTPPRLFLEDQYVAHPDTSRNSTSKNTKEFQGTKRKPPGPVKISPWTLARLNAEEVSKAAAEVKKKSKVLQPITKPKPEKSRPAKRVLFPPEQFSDACARTSASATDSNFSDMAMVTPRSLAPLQQEARSAFQPSGASSIRNLSLSPESSLDSPDLHLFRVSLSGADKLRSLMSLETSESTAQKSTVALSRSTSGGYEASGGEESDRIPSRIVHRSSNWANVINYGRREMSSDLCMRKTGGFITKTRPT